MLPAGVRAGSPGSTYPPIAASAAIRCPSGNRAVSSKLPARSFPPPGSRAGFLGEHHKHKGEQMTIHITIEPEAREGIFGAANALAALEAPVKALQEAAEALGATVMVSHAESVPAPPEKRQRRTSAQVTADKVAAKAAMDAALNVAKNGAHAHA